jgi:hypothetical protein
MHSFIRPFMSGMDIWILTILNIYLYINSCFFGQFNTSPNKRCGCKYSLYLLEDWNDYPVLVVDVKFTNEKQVEIENLNEKIRINNITKRIT